MASADDVTLTLGFDHARPELRAYLAEPIPGQDGQSLKLVAGNEVSPDLEGSGQAGTTRVYTACIRRLDTGALHEWLKAAPWHGTEAVLVVYTEWGPADVTRFGYVPSTY